MVGSFRMLLIWFFLMSCTRISTSTDTLGMSQSIGDGETLVSGGGSFELGFFSPATSAYRYLGVWYRDAAVNQTIVWVANRKRPIHSKSGVLLFNAKGILQLLNGTNSIIWSSNILGKALNNPSAQLLDSGNLVVKNGQGTKEGSFLWQSFDYPCDTLMPGMKLGLNLVTGLDRFLSCWKSADDPAVGEYSIKIDPRGYPQMVRMKGSVINTRAGPWNGLYFTGYPSPIPNIFRHNLVLNDKEVYYEFEILDRSIFSIYRTNPFGSGQLLVWTSQTRSQVENTQTGGQDRCESYAYCGSNSICTMHGNVAACECLKAYVPKFPQQWNISYWSNGCVRKAALDCNKTDGFLRYTDMKLPDTSSSWFSKNMNLEECQKSCLKNCSCTAYANLDIRNGGSGCLLWFDDLIDMRKFNQWGQDLYIRIPASELDYVAFNGHRNKKKKLVAIAVGVIIFGLTAYISIMVLRKRGGATVHNLAPFQWRQQYFRLSTETVDLPMFDLSIIAKATNNFSSSNKLGEGGFGPVYKGTLTNGQEVAIKRHSKMSDQGLEEFKNEVVLIAKLQHRNLVKLLGCCIEGEEKMLIYEYMPNKSLDYFIFDETRSRLLAWLQRFHIIGGIARGLLYLHQDSRLRIIHRDLKTSNILLDAHMNPKISDFGLARTFGEDQLEAKTKKVIGTYGYMPPEYVLHGHYSVKSDVFSFGVILLEIVSGKKNRGFSDPEHYHNLVGHAWRLWTEDRPLEMIDKQLHERCISSEVIRCIHVGLLCVQQKPEDRPDMSSVVLMLNGEKLLPHPKAPGFYSGRGSPESESSSKIVNLLSLNEMSITVFEAR